jgi:hypothetical protein
MDRVIVSAFGLYLLFRAIEAKRTVVYVRKFASLSVLFHEGRAYEFEHGVLPKLVGRLLDKKTTIYINDSVSPFKFQAFTVLITSPDRRVWYEWCKQAKACRILFPVWDLDELIALNELSGKPLTDAGIRSRFEICGGIARSVFNAALSELVLAQELKMSLGMLNPNNLLEHYFDLESATLMHDRLFALVPAGAIDDRLKPSSIAFYHYCSVDFLSRMAEEKVMSAMEAKQQQFWSKFLDRSIGIALLSLVRGRILERRALLPSAAGITLKRRRLQDDDKGCEDQ